MHLKIDEAAAYDRLIAAAREAVELMRAQDVLRVPVRALAESLELRLQAHAVREAVDVHSDLASMAAEFRRTSAWREMRESYRGVPITNRLAVSLADAGIDLTRAATMSERELLAVRGFGRTGLARLRDHLASEAEKRRCPRAR